MNSSLFHYLIVGSIVMGLGACGLPSGSNKGNPQQAGPSNTERLVMQEVRFGRFVAELDPRLAVTGSAFLIQFCDVSEISWQIEDRPKEREAVWADRLAIIREKDPPENEVDIVIEQRPVQAGTYWARAVRHFAGSSTDRLIRWDVLVDAGPVGIWLRKEGVVDYQAEILGDILRIAGAYVVRLDDAPETDAFNTGLGAVNIPYFEQEDAYIRVSGENPRIALDFQTEAVDEVEQAGLLDRLAASISSGYAGGVSINAIRKGDKTVADLEGEELIFTSGDDGEILNFMWLYTGEEDNGNRPKFSIQLESDAESKEEVIELWDDLLYTLRPVGKRN